MVWIALKHALLSHLPVAAGLLLPWALVAAQRPGRGIRPWWTVARYVAWAGLLGTLGAFLSGFASARLQGLIPAHRMLPLAASGEGPAGLLFRHVLLGAASLGVGVLALWSMNRHRRDHESLGVLALVCGLAWSAVLLLAGEGGFRLAHGTPRVPSPVPVAAPAAPVAATPKVPEAAPTVPVHALDYAALEAIHGDPVKSTVHGGRWIRAWVSPEAAAAYRAGQALPLGALVVLSSVEDRWGRPGPDLGPLYILEAKASGPELSFYWPRIPMNQRPQFGGDSRAYWHGKDPHLSACRACHAQGMADPASRSRWRASRTSGAAKTEGAGAAASPSEGGPS